jgi:PAS domain S-box-containing protein
MSDRLRVALTEVSTAASAFSESTTDYDELLKAIARSCARALGSACTLSLFDETGTMVTPVAAYDEDPKVLASFEKMFMRPRRYDQSLIGQLAPGSANIFMPHFDLESLKSGIAADGYNFLKTIGARGFVSVTMRVRGELLGVLTVMQHATDGPPLDDFDREIATHLANLAGFALSNARLFRRAQQELLGRQSAEQLATDLRESEARATAANKFLDTLLDNIPAMVFVKDAKSLKFTRFNRAGEELLGIPRLQMIGRSDFDFFPQAEAEFFIEKDREALRANKVVDIPEEPILTASGQRWLHTRKVPITDSEGEPRFLLGISHDITRQKRDMAMLEAARDSVEAANRELEAFSYSVAHDLRAPLRAIDGFSQALLEDYSEVLGEVGRGYCVRVRSSAQRMASLIDDLLMLSRVTRAVVRSQNVDLGELFAATIATLQANDPTRTVETRATGMLMATGDAKLLRIAFDNLVGNAWKFTAREAAPTIGLSVSSQHGERVYCISDNGVGFDMAYSQKLFGVFNRLHTDADFPGTGIGLATVQRIVSRHGGRVWGEAEVGKGARFYFTLGDTRTR